MTNCVASIQSFMLLHRSWEEVCGDSKVSNVEITFCFPYCSVLATEEGGHKYADSASRSQ